MEFVSLNDSYTPEKTIAATNELVGRGVFAMLGNVGTDTLDVAVTFFTAHPNLSGDTTAFAGQVRYLDSTVWQVSDSNGMAASGTWSLESIKFDDTPQIQPQPPRVVPVPAGLPLLLGALGCLIGFRRKQ